jgi:hypothetical protein
MQFVRRCPPLLLHTIGISNMFFPPLLCDICAAFDPFPDGVGGGCVLAIVTSYNFGIVSPCKVVAFLDHAGVLRASVVYSKISVVVAMCRVSVALAGIKKIYLSRL